MNTTLASIAVVLLLVVFAGCAGEPKQTAPPATPSTPAPVELVAKGKALYANKACGACHGANGEGLPNVGPVLRGLYATQRELDTGQKVTADDAYLMESVKNPDAKTAKGFQKGMMSATVPPNSLSDEDARALVEYIKTLK